MYVVYKQSFYRILNFIPHIISTDNHLLIAVVWWFRTQARVVSVSIELYAGYK